MGTMVSLYIYSLKIYSSKDMTHPEVLVSLLAKTTTRFTKLYICPANTALTSSYTFFRSPISLSLAIGTSSILLIAAG